MTCTDNEPCIACEMERLNQGGPPRSLERGPTVMESGIGGMAVGFGLYLGFTLVWGLGGVIDYLLTLRGFGQWSFIALLGSGFLAGIWNATVRRR